MIRILNKPHVAFWIMAIYVLARGYYIHIINDNSALDINIHDTYFVVAHTHIAHILFFLFTLLGFIYFSFSITKIELVKNLTKIHVFITIISVFVNDLAKPLLYDYNNKNFPLFDRTVNYQSFFTILIIIVLIAQILFILNITYSSVKTFILRHNN